MNAETTIAGLLTFFFAAAGIAMAFMAWMCWRHPRDPKRQAVGMQRYGENLHGLHSGALFMVLGSLAWLLAHRFGGQFGENQDEAWDRWHGVVVDTFAAVCLLIVAGILGYWELGVKKLWGSFLLALLVVSLTYVWWHHNDDPKTN